MAYSILARIRDTEGDLDEEKSGHNYNKRSDVAKENTQNGGIINPYFEQRLHILTWKKTWRKEGEGGREEERDRQREREGSKSLLCHYLFEKEVGVESNPQPPK